MSYLDDDPPVPSTPAGSDDDSAASSSSSSSRIDRRRFVRDAALAAGTLAIGGLGKLERALAAVLPPPGDSGVDHFVVVMMENRSFDHFLGWMKNADGEQGRLAFPDRSGVLVPTHRLAPDFQGCGHPDPDHSYEGGRIELSGGACDGWLRAGENDEFAIGYYTKRDLAFFGPAATEWTVCDRYFSSIMAETYPNRFHQHCAQTDRIVNTFDLTDLPTIWDRLAAAGLEGRYYFSDVPFLALWGLKYLPIARPLVSFLADAAAGTLPHVSFVEPRFLDPTTGTSGDDHPYADIRNGQAFLNLVYSAVTSSPAWERTVLVITYDEWGGFFDHVPPEPAPIPPADQAAGNQDGLRGFRVPCLVVSPFARRGGVSSTVFDHASILRMIEWRFGLEPLTVRDATANNLAEVLDFANRDRNKRPPRFNVPTGPFGVPCDPFLDKWQTLLEIARGLGWPF